MNEAVTCFVVWVRSVFFICLFTTMAAVYESRCAHKITDVACCNSFSHTCGLYRSVVKEVAEFLRKPPGAVQRIIGSKERLCQAESLQIQLDDFPKQMNVRHIRL